MTDSRNAGSLGSDAPESASVIPTSDAPKVVTCDHANTVSGSEVELCSDCGGMWHLYTGAVLNANHADGLGWGEASDG
jgi:hypothetical protein